MKKVFPLLLLAVSVQSFAAPINNLDCTDEEIATYIDQSGYQRERGFNTIPNYEEYKPAHIKKETIENGEEAGNSCTTIFDEGIDTSGGKAVWDKVSGIFSDPIGTITGIGKSATGRIEDIYEQMSEQLKKGVCERLSMDNVQDTIGDKLNKVYRESTSDTVLSGTTVGMDDILTGGGINGGTTIDPSEAIGKNFTYKIIKNQLGKNGSTIAKLLDISNPNQAGKVIDYGSGAVEDQLDAIEDAIFGR